jgi:hypothetical protein
MLSEPGIPPHELHLKVGAVCGIMRNLSVEKGLVKSVRVRVVALHRYIVRVELLRDQSASLDDRFFYLPRVNFDFQPRQTIWTVERRQFPLRLASATTFNSCQGLTLDQVCWTSPHSFSLTANSTPVCPVLERGTIFTQYFHRTITTVLCPILFTINSYCLLTTRNSSG